MLDALELCPGQSVLEIGTGWNAALLYQRVGDRGKVVSIEVDAGIARSARAALARAGYSPLVICGNGVESYSNVAPYHRVLATASVRPKSARRIGRYLSRPLVSLGAQSAQ